MVGREYGEKGMHNDGRPDALAQRIQDRRDGEYPPDEYPDDRTFF